MGAGRKGDCEDVFVAALTPSVQVSRFASHLGAASRRRGAWRGDQRSNRGGARWARQPHENGRNHHATTTTAHCLDRHRGRAGPGLLAWAYVNANGTVASSSGNVTVANPGAGSYCIGVTGGTAHVAVASLDSLENTGGTVQAGVFPASECPANAQNILVVTRPQSQDGGFPGVNHAFYIIVS